MAQAIIKTENLLKTYGGSGVFVNAVNKVSLTIYEGEFTAIVGASGSGKSTLLHLMGGIDEPSGGTVYVYNANDPPVNLYKLSRNALADFRGKNFGFVFQNYALLPVLTAWENVMIPSIYSKTEFNTGYARELLEKLGLKDRVNHLPSELSGGEQQRVAVIRAIVGRPRILFADEPTGNLDRKNGDELTALLLRLRSDICCTVVMVTHDPRIASAADRIVTMQDGEII